MKQIFMNLKQKAQKIWENYWKDVVEPYGEALMHGGSCGFV